LAVEDSLRRLHSAFVASNKSTSIHKPLGLSVWILEAADCLRTRKRLLVQHTYLQFRDDSTVYPLQFHAEEETDSKMVLAETLLASKIPPDLQLVTENDVSLPAELCNLDPGADESFRPIGCIVTPGVSSDKYQLVQDISISWEMQITLNDLIRGTKK